MGIATLGGGCFWCLEAVFEQARGVESVVCGYTGGAHPKPSYEEVCLGHTGHAEVVQIGFDPEVISYREILEIFFAIHDPTTLNRQGNDIGTQYRSVVFYHTPEQKEVASRLIAELDAQQIWPALIVTQLMPAPTFYRAEDYHQQYFRNHPHQGYCTYVVAPKVAKFRQGFRSRLKGSSG